MNDYIGLDVSRKETAVSIRRMESAFGVASARPDPRFRPTVWDPQTYAHGQAGIVFDNRSIVGLVLSRTDGRGLVGDFASMRVMPKLALTWLLASKSGCESSGDGLGLDRGGRVLPGGAGQRIWTVTFARTLVAAMRTRSH